MKLEKILELERVTFSKDNQKLLVDMLSDWEAADDDHSAWMRWKAHQWFIAPLRAMMTTVDVEWERWEQRCSRRPRY